MKYSYILKNRIFKETMLYGLTNVLYSGLPFILLPFLIVVLEPEDFGLADLFRTISMILTPILGFSAVQSIGRLYFELDEGKFKVLVSSIQIFQLLMAVIALIVVVAMKSMFENTTFTLLVSSILYFFLNQFTESLLTIFRVKQKAKKYMVIRVTNIVLELGFLFMLYRFLGELDWTSRVYPSVIATAIMAIVSAVVFWRDGYRVCFSRKMLVTSLTYSAPLVIHMLSGYMLNVGDRFFIKYYLTVEDLGNYAAAYQVGMAVNFFFTSFNLAWTPAYFKWMKEKKYGEIKRIKKVVYGSLLFIGIVISLLWTFTEKYFLHHINYEISTEVVVVILLANILLSLYKFEANSLLYNKKTKKLSSITFISALVSVFLNIILIPKLGIQGAAYTTFLSILLMYVLIIHNNANEKNNIEF